MEWNENQKTVLDTLDGNILVSASAGSGKTSVMIERTMRILLKRKIHIQRVVMLSFNNDIAAEMKEKLRKALENFAKNPDSDSELAVRQLDALPLANISTFHGFCKNLISEYSEHTTFPASFSVLEPNFADTLFNRALNTVFDEYNALNDAVFLSLKRCISGGRRDAGLRETVTKMHRFMCVQLDRKEWLKHAAREFSDLDNSEAVKSAINENSSHAEFVLEELYGAKATFVENKKELPPYFQEAIDFLCALKNAKDAKDLCELPAITNSKPRFALTKELVNDFERIREKLAVFTDISFEQLTVTSKKSQKFIEKLVEIVLRVDNEFSELKRAENKLDYNDLELGALEILSNDEVSKEIQARYDYVSVDEYQDINHVQEYIIKKVACENNLFTVGDSKQSIYGFRLTETEIMLNRADSYRDGGGKVEHFNYNYRSDPEILSFVNDIFTRVMTADFGGVDYKRDAMFKIMRGKNDTAEKVVSVDFFLNERARAESAVLPPDGIYSPTQHVYAEEGDGERPAEAMFIASKIKELVESGVKYDEITVLVSKRSKQSKEILTAVSETGIPIDMSVFAETKPKRARHEITNLLTAIGDMRDDICLAECMAGVFGNFSYQELLDIRRKNPNKRLFSEAVFASDDLKTQEFVKKLLRWREMSGYLTVSELINEIALETDYRAHRDFVSEIKDKPYAVTLAGYLYATKNLVRDESAEGQPTASGDSVKVLTIHASKGLEFNTVFLIDACRAFNTKTDSVLFDKNLGVALKSYDEDTLAKYDSPAYELAKRRQNKRLSEERMRLLYVALTRAKRRLFVTGTKTLEKDEKTLFTAAGQYKERILGASDFSDFIYSANNAGNYITEHTGFEEFKTDLPQKPTTETVKIFKPAEINPKPYPYESSVKTAFKNTVTQINGEEGRFNLHTQGSVRETAARGTAYHKIMENIDYSANSNEAVKNEIETMVANGVLSSDEASETDPNVISKCLGSKFMREISACKVLHEKSFMLYVPAKDVTAHADIEDKILIQGTIDALVLPNNENDSALIIDFKRTGRTARAVRDTYKRQIEIYKYAVERVLGFKNVKAYIYILGSDEIVEF